MNRVTTLAVLFFVLLAAAPAAGRPGPLKSRLAALGDRFYRVGLVRSIIATGVERAFHRQARGPHGRSHLGVLEGTALRVGPAGLSGAVKASWFHKQPTIYACAFGSRWAVPARGDSEKRFETRYIVPRQDRFKTLVQSCFLGTPRTVRFEAPQPTAGGQP